jgi:peptidoglycan/xylan/chitin deacetylase (PgdA/CDA1 family)
VDPLNSAPDTGKGPGANAAPDARVARDPVNRQLASPTDSTFETMIGHSKAGFRAPEKSPLRKLVEDLGMRVAGRTGVGLNRLLGSRAAGALGILTYHRIAPHVPGVPKPPHNVPPERFREQLAGLLDRGFAVWPLSRILQCRAQGDSSPRRTLAITFDDGFQTVYTHAWPILRELQLPATVFLTTAYRDSDRAFWFDSWGNTYRNRVPPETYRPLTSAQSRQMVQEGLVELGAHTHTHQDFRHRPEDLRRDLQTSVDILRSCFAQKEVAFAFPFGSNHLGYAGSELVTAAKQTGVVCGLTTESVVVDIRSDPFRWGRFTAFPWDTAATLAAKLHGWYSWAPRLRQQIARAFPEFRRRPRSSIRGFVESSGAQRTFVKHPNRGDRSP